MTKAYAVALTEVYHELCPAMTRKAVPYKGEKYYYYYCPTTKKRGCTAPANLKESELSDCILESVKAHIANVASFEEIFRNSRFNP